MAAFDYERCWGELLALLEVSERPNWGARQVREEMARIMGRNQRPLESGVAQLLRLYGVEVDAAALRNLTNQRDASPTVPVAEGSRDMDLGSPAHRVTEEVIDERRTEGFAGFAAHVDGGACRSAAA